MKKSDFYYDLPEELIAQTPVSPRNSSRLMAIERCSGAIEHRHFHDLADYLKSGDCLILNNTRVLPARIFGIKEDTGAVVEFVLLKQKENMVWECLAGPGRRAKPGTRFSFGDGILHAQVLDVVEGNRLVKFECDGVFFDVLDRVGQMPLPPYIHEKLADKERYQTVYSKELGSAAAPTAGLHFTPDMLNELAQNGVKIGYVTLHVGLGTFRPVKEEEITNHKMHSEHYFMPAETVKLINETKKNGGRVICVGTTGCRTVESVFSFMMRDEENSIEYIQNGVGKRVALLPENRDFSGDTDIFIYPGYEFKCMDGLITNFHLPESTLIMLVSAFLGYDKTMNAYKTAVDEKYRFFSFGDAMLIL